MGLFDSVNPISAISTGIQGAVGIAQMAAGFFQKKPKLNEYQIPQEVLDNMSQAERMSFEGLPEAQKQQYIQNIQRSGATALSSSTSRKGGLGLVASVGQQQQDAYMNLLSADSEARMNNIQNLFSARSAMAAEREKKFQIKRENIMEKRQNIDKLRGAGMQNTMGALGSLSELATGSKKTSLKDSGTPEGVSRIDPKTIKLGNGVDDPNKLR